MIWVQFAAPESGGLMPVTAVNSRSLTCSVLQPVSRAHCSDACDEARSGARYRRTPGRCFRPYMPADCSCHSECVLGAEAVWVPTIDCRHRTRIRSDERRKRKHAMAVFAAPCRQGRNHGMAHPRQYASAFTAVIQGIFLEGFSQPITRRCSNSRDGVGGTKSLAKTFSPLVPLWRRIAPLVDASHDRSAGNWVGTICVKHVISGHCSLRRTHRLLWLPAESPWQACKGLEIHI
jgi:hypothetical protein